MEGGTALLTVADVMTREVVTVGPETSVPEIAQILHAKRISGVPVVAADGSVVGIVSEGDLMGHALAVGEQRGSWWLTFFSGNGGSQTYRANRAERSAWERALRPKPCRLALHVELRWRVAQKLALQWSPEQISGWLKQQFPTDRDMRISHEAIYRSLFVQTRGVLKKELTAQLRTRRQMRHAKGGKAKNGQGHILDMVSIRERPAEAEDRAVPGHWEGDLLTGASDTHIVTLVERHSRFTMLVKLPRKDTTTVVAALARHIRKLPEQLRRSLTWDQGKEMSGHKRFTVATNVQVYFCDP